MYQLTKQLQKKKPSNQKESTHSGLTLYNVLNDTVDFRCNALTCFEASAAYNIFQVAALVAMQKQTAFPAFIAMLIAMLHSSNIAIAFYKQIYGIHLLNNSLIFVELGTLLYKHKNQQINFTY
jgi:hypothetical protein